MQLSNNNLQKPTLCLMPLSSQFPHPIYFNLPLSYNPLSASYCCDARMGGCLTYGLRGMISRYIRRPPIKRHLSPQLTSHISISTRISKFQWSPFCAESLWLTIIWCHLLTMSLRGLKSDRHSRAHGYCSFFCRFASMAVTQPNRNRGENLI